MSDHTSYSQISMLLRCEAQWGFRYRDGIKKPPSAAMSLGSAFEDGILSSYQHQIESGDPLPTPEVAEMSVTSLETRKDSTEWDESFDAVKDEMPAMVENYQDGKTHFGWNPDESKFTEQAGCPSQLLAPKAVQEKLEITTDAAPPIIAYLDIRDDNDDVCDLKTARRSWPKNRAKADLQSVVYTLPEPGDSTFTWHIAVRTKKPRVQVIHRRVSSDTKRGLLTVLPSISKRMEEIKSGAPALPNGYGGTLCSRRYCGFWHECQKVWGLPIPV